MLNIYLPEARLRRLGAPRNLWVAQGMGKTGFLFLGSSPCVSSEVTY